MHERQIRNARAEDGECKSGLRGVQVADKECMRGRSEMQERWMGNARVVREECKWQIRSA